MPYNKRIIKEGSKARKNTAHSTSRSRRRERREKERRRAALRDMAEHQKDNFQQVDEESFDTINQLNEMNLDMDRSLMMKEEMKREVRYPVSCKCGEVLENERRRSESFSTESTQSIVSDLSDESSSLNTKNDLRTTKKKIKKGKKNKSKNNLKPPEFVDETRNYVALDCEMVGLGSDGMESAVARVSLVNWDGQVMIDTYLRVSEPVTDFRTSVSGIRQCDIDSDFAMDLDDCKKIVKDLIKDKILVGHGLKNDLQVLDIEHPWYRIRDTAKYKPFMKNCEVNVCTQLPRKLKELAKDFLGLDIQTDADGHDSVIDAWVAMELYKLERVQWEKVMEWKIERTREIEKNHAMCQ